MNANNLDSLMQRAMFLCQQGDLSHALVYMRQAAALESELKPKVIEMISSVLAELSPKEYHPELESDLQLCFSEKSIDHQCLSHLCANQLLHKHKITDATTHDNKQLENIVNNTTEHSLWINFLSQCINSSPLMEKTLTAIRQELLNTAELCEELSETEIAFIISLCEQCYANEYVFHCTQKEMDLCLGITKKPESLKNILIQALYRPIAKEHLAFLQESSNTSLQSLIKKTIIYPAEENTIKNEITSFIDSSNIVSKLVRSQYEVNPYPRWQALPSKKNVSLVNLIERHANFNQAIFSKLPLDILVAGCGTGFEPIEIAMMNNVNEVTAIDLSLSSLAYGIRMSRQLNIKNIRFHHEDILNLRKTTKHFDVVTSRGVLHHMDSTEDGWASLVKVTKPGGIMRISLYSRLARRQITAIRNNIDKLDDINTDAIKDFRKNALDNTSNEDISTIIDSEDFYSVSGCRDLLFHTHEHCFDLTQIKSIIDNLGLNFIGLDLPSPDIEYEFKKMFPEKDAIENLSHWHDFEEKHPDTFAGMYKIWCQKIA